MFTTPPPFHNGHFLLPAQTYCSASKGSSLPVPHSILQLPTNRLCTWQKPELVLIEISREINWRVSLQVNGHTHCTCKEGVNQQQQQLSTLTLQLTLHDSRIPQLRFLPLSLFLTLTFCLLLLPECMVRGNTHYHA